MKRVGIISIFMLFFLNSFSQKIHLKHPVYLDIIEKYVYVISKSDSTVLSNQSRNETSSLKVFDFTSTGRLNFIYHNNSENIVIKGQYKEATKLSPPKGYRRDGIRVSVTKNGISQSYYAPFRNGTWYYYDNFGKLLRQEKYNNGVLSNE